jgi:hypothetical protein
MAWATARPREAPFQLPLIQATCPLLDFFFGKKLHDNLLARPTTEDITPKRPFTLCLYPTPDLPTPTPTNEHHALVISDKSKDDLSLTNSESTRSTTPNPKRVKYELSGRQLPSRRYEKVLHRLDSSDAKTIEGSLSAPSVRCRLSPPPIHGSPRQMEHSKDEKAELTLEGL